MVAVDRGDPQPVISGTFGEGHAEYEQADQQCSRFSPGSPRAATLPGACLIGLGFTYETSSGERANCCYEDGDDGVVNCRADMQRVHCCAGERASDGAHTERRVEPRHDRTTEPLLDDGALNILCDVPLTGPETEQEQASANHCRSNVGADSRDTKPNRGDDCHNRHSAGRTDSMHDGASQWQGNQRSNGRHQQQQSEWTRAKVQFVAHLRDTRQHGGDHKSRDREHQVDAARSPRRKLLISVQLRAPPSS